MSFNTDWKEEDIDKLLKQIKNETTITEKMANELEYLGLCNSEYWLDLQRIYDEKLQKNGQKL